MRHEFRPDKINKRIEIPYGCDLGNIKAKALIFGSVDDIYYSSKYDTLPLNQLIKDSKIVLYDSLKDHNGFEDYSVLFDDFKEFLIEFKEKI